MPICVGRSSATERPGLALIEQVPEPPVRVLRTAPTRIQSHRPQPPAVHARVDAAGERVLAGDADSGRVVVAGHVERRVQRLDGNPGVGLRVGELADRCVPARERALEPGARLGDLAFDGLRHGAVYRI